MEYKVKYKVKYEEQVKGKAVLECCCKVGRPTPLILTSCAWALSRPEVQMETKWNPRIKNLRSEIVPVSPEVLPRQYEYTFANGGQIHTEMVTVLPEETPWRITGNCPNCGEFFDLRWTHSADPLETYHGYDWHMLNIIRPHVRLREDAGSLKNMPSTLDWIPSGGTNTAQRLTLNRQKLMFAVAAKDAVALGMPDAMFPDWYDHGTDEQFKMWFEEIREALSSHRRTISRRYGNALDAYYESQIPKVKEQCQMRAQQVRTTLKTGS